LELRVDGFAAHQTLSRGEAKLACIALWIAQARDHLLQSGRKPVVLIDDLAAELDPENRRRVFATLSELGCQSFVTSVSDRLGKDACAAFKGFHVERGKFREMV
jgi:DNA replication and repair protein RecF